MQSSKAAMRNHNQCDRDPQRTIMPMAPSDRLALRLLGAAGTRSTFWDSSAWADATCKTTSSGTSCHMWTSLDNLTPEWQS